MDEFYAQFYRATAGSRAYSEFCRRLYGADFSQHGFADQVQINKLLEVSGLGPGQSALDLGCGSGGMAAYMACVTGARVTGLDLCPEAIRRAQALAAPGTEGAALLTFVEGDLADPAFPPGSFDLIIGVDSLYFVEDQLDAVLARDCTLLKPGGKLAFYYAYGADPMRPIATFDRRTLSPDKTLLGAALTRAGIPFRTWDFTAADYAQAQVQQALLDELRPAFELEGAGFLVENRYGEATGIQAAIEAGCHVRYLYLATPAIR